MRPLEHLVDTSFSQGKGAGLLRLLRSAPEQDVQAELLRLSEAELTGEQAAALCYGQGALAMRGARWDEARDCFEKAADSFVDSEAKELCRCEWWLAKMRLGPRKVLDSAQDVLASLGSGQSRLVAVVAAHYRGTALRMAGAAEETLPVLLGALEQSEGLLPERAQVLNSLGTLYVVLGAHAAALSVLEHAAELNHQLGDRVSEAISYGQLGSAALARGERATARSYLQQQYDCAGKVGDAFGQARALVFLADLALELKRPDDALQLARKAVALAERGAVPMEIWVAYGRRNVARALLELKERGAEEELRQAAALFKKMGNVLGGALVGWDRARMQSPRDPVAWPKAMLASARILADLGLSARLVQVLAELRDAEDGCEKQQLEGAIAACAQIFPHLDQGHSADWAYQKGEVIGAIAGRRLGGQRNCARLAVLVASPPGLYLAVLVADEVGSPMAQPAQRCAAALVARLPGCLLWAWPGETDLQFVARDLSALAERFGGAASLALCHSPTAQVRSVPMQGEVGADLRPANAVSRLLSQAQSCPRGQMVVDASIDWAGDCEALVRMAGIRSRP